MASGADVPPPTATTETAPPSAGEAGPRPLGEAVAGLFSQFLVDVVAAPVKYGGRKVSCVALHARE